MKLYRTPPAEFEESLYVVSAGDWLIYLSGDTMFKIRAELYPDWALRQVFDFLNTECQIEREDVSTIMRRAGRWSKRQVYGNI